MRVVFIAKNRHQEETIANNLKEFSEQDSIAFFYSYDEAKDFLNNYIVKEQITVDLIITEDNILGKSVFDFQQEIINDKKRVYSNYDFNLSAIPLVLIVGKNQNRNAYLKYGFSEVLDNIGLDKLHLFISELLSPVKTWRRKVLDELDNLGIKFNSGSIDYSYYFSKERKRKVDTNVLSENFRRFQRSLSYEWLETNDKQIEKAIDEFIKELKIATRLNKKKDEKKFHKLFNKYPFLLKRDNYSKHWYEPSTKSHYYEPDFSLKPNFSQRTDLSIVEVKLPNEKFIKKTKFHSGPYSNILSHVFQVNDYKEYLESDEYHSLIKKVFSFVPGSVEYNILIGRLDDKTNGFSVFNRRMKQMNALNINFITYDELLDYQVKYLERVNLLKIL